jgi:F0F1-type ATP synthase membrane subunit b/b'
VLQTVLKQNDILQERNKKLKSELLESNKIIQKLQSENSEYTSQLRSLKEEKEELLLR